MCGKTELSEEFPRFFMLSTKRRMGGRICSGDDQNSDWKFHFRRALETMSES